MDQLLVKKQATTNMDSTIKDEDYDPNEMFSEFKFRSFKKDRQIKQDYTLIDFQDPDDMSLLTASTVYPENQLVRDSVELVGIEQT
jgi:hypothetical protein